MADYCTVKDVESEFKDTEFTTDTNVTKKDVEKFIVQACSLINSYVGQRYVVPVTADASSLDLLKYWASVLVADRIKGNLEVKQETNKDANKNVRTSALNTKDILKLLEAVKNGELLLSGATLSTAQGGFYSNNYANSVEPVFHKDRREW